MVSSEKRVNFEGDYFSIDPNLRPLIPQFLVNRKSDAQKLEGLARNRDHLALRDLGHNLKGVCSNFGFLGLAQIGAEIEEIASRGPMANLEDIKELITRFQVSINSLQEKLDVA